MAKRTGPNFEYVLGDHAREAARLRAQARLWDPVSHALFDRIGAHGYFVMAAMSLAGLAGAVRLYGVRRLDG